MSKEFRIKEVKVTDGPEAEVTIMCKSAQVEEFEHTACFPYNSTKDAIMTRLSQISDDAIDNKFQQQKGQAAIDQEIQAKRDMCETLKNEIDMMKG